MTEGMKALLLDQATTQIMSAVYSQTQILEQEVYLVEILGKRHEPMMHLKAAIFVQPTENNLAMLTKELKEPKFAEYHIFFSNIYLVSFLLSFVYSSFFFRAHVYFLYYFLKNSTNMSSKLR